MLCILEFIMDTALDFVSLQTEIYVSVATTTMNVVLHIESVS